MTPAKGARAGDAMSRREMLGLLSAGVAMLTGVPARLPALPTRPAAWA